MLVRLSAVSRVFPAGESEVHALRDVDLDIDSGELCAITGASGSGKSTALNLLGTLDRPSSGRYFLDGEPIEDKDDVELARIRNRKIGFVFQSFHLLARDSALENVELPMIYSGMRPRDRREKARRALDRVGLGDRVHHKPNQLSGGQQQRVAIARAIVNDPVLLLADEPTGALDSANAASVMDLLLEQSARGMTIVIVTHDPNVAARAHRVVTFKDGQIVGEPS
jgi:putative ABC transport system ATP-binding protein